MLPDILETARLRLRPFRLRDVDAVLAYAMDPEWARYLPVPQPYTPADAEQFLAGQVLLDREVHPAWAIEYAEPSLAASTSAFILTITWVKWATALRDATGGKAWPLKRRAPSWRRHLLRMPP